MEKLKLKALKLGAKDLLTKEEMKKINGGTGCSPVSCMNGDGDSGTCSQNPFAECQCDIFGFFYQAPQCFFQ